MPALLPCIRTLIALAAAVSVAACATRQSAPYVPPDTPAGRLKSIAYLPHVGTSVDIFEQQLRAQEFADWWNDVYPGTRWVLSKVTAEAIATARLTDAWLGAERAALQLGQLPQPVRQQLCETLQTNGLLQINVQGVTAGTAASSLLTPWWWANRGTPSSARMTAVLFSCRTQQVLWSRSEELNYRSGYSFSEMVDYVHRAVAAHIPR